MSSCNESRVERFKGCLIGLAVGDALGTTLEFKAPGSFDPIDDMVGGGPFGLLPGQWTDDTSMALCLAESLVECERFDPVDQLQRYVRWYKNGHLSSTGKCFDIGNTVRAALERFIKTGDSYCGSEDPRTAGNGSLMRLAPAAMASAHDEDAIRMCADSSRTTHAAKEAVDACRLFGSMLVRALNGASKEDVLRPDIKELAPKIDAIAKGSYKTRNPPDIRGTGYAVDALEAALWAFHRSSSFREGALMAVNLGDDADTTGAIYGQIAGAHYGLDGIPHEWVEKLSMRELIESMADSLRAMAAPTTPAVAPQPESSHE